MTAGIRNFLSITIALLLFFVAISVQAQQPSSDLHILIINSYHRGFEWSDDEETGFIQRLREVYPTADISIEFLDTKRYPNLRNLSRMKDFLLSKYKERKIDLLVVFDNPALDMIAQYRSVLFPEVPVVFAGVSGFEQSFLRGRKKVTGVVEMQDVKKTIEIALLLHPGTKEVLIIDDTTITGLSLRREVESLVPLFVGRVKFHFLLPSTFRKIQSQIGSLPKDAIVVITSFSTDHEGRAASLQESTRIFTAPAKVPVYAMHEARLGYGIVGGSLLGGADHGRRAADIALRILAGEDVATIPVDTTGTARPMFDDQQLKRYHINRKLLPSDSIIINEPESIFTKYRAFVLGSLAIVTILGTMVVFLTAAIVRRKKAEEELLRTHFYVNKASLGIHRVSDDGKILDVNEGMCLNLGYSREELLSMTIFDIDPTFDPEKFQEHRKKLYAEGGSRTIESQHRRKDGSIFPVEVSVNHLLYQGKEFTVSFAKDITERKQAEEALRESEQRFRIIAEASFEGIALSESGVLQDVNDQLANMLGYKRSELIGQPIMNFIAPEHYDLVTDAIRSGRLDPYENLLVRKGGAKILVESRARSAQIGGRKVRLTAIRDITEWKRADQVLRFTQFTMDRMMDQAFWMTNDGKFVYVNEAASRCLGYSREELLTMSVPDIDPSCPPEVFARQWHTLKENGSSIYEAIHQAKDGRTYPVEIHSNYFVFDGKEYNCAFATDITKRKETEQRIHNLAFYDPLTGLPNRAFYKELLNQALERARRHNTMMAVLFLDLDNFKRINDLLGHDAGDRLLREVSEALSRCVRKSDFVAYSEEGGNGNIVSRLGGDEFIVLLGEVSSANDVARIAQRILDELARLFTVADQEIVVSASIGIALFPEDGQDAESLLKSADVAMYHAKATGKKSYQFYTASMHVRSLERMQLENKLHRALSRNEFVLLFQPTVSAHQKAVIGTEALIRWQPRDCGLLAQSEFIALAEETGLIMPIGQWVLNTACAQNRAWQKSGIGPLKVAVNLSSRQFDNQNIKEMVSQALQGSELAPQYLELEITESAIMQNPEKAAATLRQLKNMGVSIALDDFGTGYSSLAHLRRFPLDALKIDRSFIANITTSSEDVAIVTAIIAMAHGLNLRVVAEGVESRCQLDLLQRLGCDEFQGFLFSHPLPTEGASGCARKDRHQHESSMHSACSKNGHGIESIITHVQKFRHYWNDRQDKWIDILQE